MELDTTGAVSMDVLGEANMVLRANDVSLPEPWQESTKFLAPEELHHILYNWNVATNGKFILATSQTTPLTGF